MYRFIDDDTTGIYVISFDGIMVGGQSTTVHSPVLSDDQWVPSKVSAVGAESGLRSCRSLACRDSGFLHRLSSCARYGRAPGRIGRKAMMLEDQIKILLNIPRPMLIHVYLAQVTSAAPICPIVQWIPPLKTPQTY